jgi:hypothetical protein
VLFLSHCWGFWVVGFSVRLLPLATFLEALYLEEVEIAFNPGNAGHRGDKKEVKEQGSE